MNPTVFPNNIDDRTYFNDVSLKHADTYQGFVERVRNQQYQSASTYLRNNAGTMDYYGADLFNELDDRIRKVEIYATEVAETTNTHVSYSNTKPVDIDEGMIWVG